MKQHRWVQIIWIPCILSRNEDSHWFAKLDGNKQPLDYPMQFHCFDCEQNVNDCWGEPCPGRYGTGAKDDIDDRIDPKLWEDIEYGTGAESQSR